MYKFNDKYIKGLLIFLISIGIILPMILVFRLIFTENSSYLITLFENDIIWKYLIKTFELIFKVMFFSIIIGFTAAYIVTAYDFKYKKILKVTLTIPLAIPVYIGAYTYTSIFYENSFLEIILKNDFMLNGSVFIYTIFLYPYVYLASRSYLKRNLVDYIEASQTLKTNKFKTFVKIIFPLSWPAVFGSALFVIFETLSDFEVVRYYGVETISKIIWDSWLSIGQKETAAKVSVILLISLFLLILLEKLIRRNKRYNGISNRELKPKKLSRLKTSLVYLLLSPVVILGVYLPIKEMLSFAVVKYQYFDLALLGITLNTFITIFITLMLILVSGSIFASLTNLVKKNKSVYSTIGVMGYSIPSLILALGVYIFANSIDKFIYTNFKFIDTRLLTGTRGALIIALTIKFISIAFSNYYSTLQKQNKSIFEASRTLKHNDVSSYFRINLPLLKKTTPFIVIIVFIDLIKELTLTYSLRPFNFKTLSTEVYRYAHNEMIEVAAIPSLIIVGISILLIIYLEVGYNARDKKS